jgi:soluble lytic murein transglycosylase-like protein
MSAGWKLAGVATLWLPTLAAAESKFAIPTDLLARIAFQESSFRPSVISGAVKSKPGAVGIMQLLPKYFPGAGVSPAADINMAAGFLSHLFHRFGDWQEAVAAYNWGEGSEHHSFVEHGAYILADMPIETQNYVREVFADVPIQGALLT